MTEKAVENPLSPKSANQPKRVLVQFSLHAVDGDGSILTLKVATHLNTSCCLIEAGSIIRLGNCNPVYYNYNDKEDDRVAIVVTSFDVIGIQPISPLLLLPPKERLKVVLSESNEDETDLPKKEDLKKIEPKDCKGQLCKSPRVHFIRCVTHCFPVKSLVLTEIAKSCPFVNMSVAEMSNSQKRNLVYWWYAVNIYFVAGKSNRWKHGECLLYAVRAEFPESDGHYTGHVDASSPY
jgi:hypothetical protein